MQASHLYRIKTPSTYAHRMFNFDPGSYRHTIISYGMTFWWDFCSNHLNLVHAPAWKSIPIGETFPRWLSLHTEVCTIFQNQHEFLFGDFVIFTKFWWSNPLFPASGTINWWVFLFGGDFFAVFHFFLFWGKYTLHTKYQWSFVRLPHYVWKMGEIMIHIKYHYRFRNGNGNLTVNRLNIVLCV